MLNRSSASQERMRVHEVSGHDFSRAEKIANPTWALAPAQSFTQAQSDGSSSLPSAAERKKSK